MNDTPPNVPLLIAAGLLQLALLQLVVLWLARGTALRFRWLRMYALVFGLCLLSLPFVAVLRWFPPEASTSRRHLALVAAFVPFLAASGVAFRRVYQLERRKKTTSRPPPGAST